jgi:hypothetical protein
VAGALEPAATLEAASGWGNLFFSLISLALFSGAEYAVLILQNQILQNQ